MHEDTSQIDFPFAGRRQVRAAFDAGPISRDGGLLLLRQADRRLGLTDIAPWERVASAGRSATA